MAKGRPKSGKNVVTVIHIRGSSPWKDWYRRLVKHARMSGPALIERALIEWASRNNFREIPPER